MDLDPSRLRSGEVLAGVSAAALLVLLFAVNWYGTNTVTPGLSPGPVNGWHGLVHVRWLTVVTIGATFVLVILQLTRPAPALPVTASVFVVLLALANVAWLAYRVLVSVPPQQKAVAYVALACAAGIVVGAYVSMRQEGISPKDEPQEIPTVSLGRVSRRPEEGTRAAADEGTGSPPEGARRSS